MTFFHFLRGLWLRVTMPVRGFYADTVFLSELLLCPSDEFIAERKAEKEAIEGGARLTGHDHPLIKAAKPVGKPDKAAFSFEIEHPFSVLCPDCRQATIELLKRNQQAREEAMSAHC